MHGWIVDWFHAAIVIFCLECMSYEKEFILVLMGYMCYDVDWNCKNSETTKKKKKLSDIYWDYTVLRMDEFLSSI